MYGITNSRLVINNAPSDVVKVASNSILYAGDLVLVDSNNIATAFTAWDGVDSTRTKKLGQLLETASASDGTTLYDCRLLATKWANPVDSDGFPTCYNESYVQLSGPYQNRYHISNSRLSVVPHNSDVSINMQKLDFIMCISNVNLGTSLNTNILNFYAGDTNAFKLRIVAGSNNEWSLSGQYVNNGGTTKLFTLITNEESANFTNFGNTKSRLYVRLDNKNISTVGGMALLTVYYIDDVTYSNSYTFSNTLTLDDFGNPPSGNLTITKGIFGMGSGFSDTDASYDIITTSTGFGNGADYSPYYMMSSQYGKISILTTIAGK